MDLFNVSNTHGGREDGSGPGGQVPYTFTEDEDSDSPEPAKVYTTLSQTSPFTN